MVILKCYLALRNWTYDTLAIDPDTVWSVSFSPDGDSLATASVDRTARLWTIATPEDLLVRDCDCIRPLLNEEIYDQYGPDFCKGFGTEE